MNLTLMLQFEKRIELLSNTGEILREFLTDNLNSNSISDKLTTAVKATSVANPWFTDFFIRKALGEWAQQLTKAKLTKWLENYNIPANLLQKQIAIIMAGNFPLAGFHDFISVVLSGHKTIARMSGDDSILLPAIFGIMCEISPEIKEEVILTQGQVKDFDAVIATGSGNTSRYFDHYFSKYPNIIRKNRTGIAVLTGNETKEELNGIANDVFDYYGLGCRNVSKLLVPRDYRFDLLFEAFSTFDNIAQHSKYYNNYNYQKSILIINKVPFFDHHNVILKEDDALAAPVGMLYFSYYDSIDDADRIVSDLSEQLQVVVSVSDQIREAIKPGATQQPGLDDYADGIDTVSFLLGL